MSLLQQTSVCKYTKILQEKLWINFVGQGICTMQNCVLLETVKSIVWEWINYFYRENTYEKNNQVDVCVLRRSNGK